MTIRACLSIAMKCSALSERSYTCKIRLSRSRSRSTFMTCPATLPLLAPHLRRPRAMTVYSARNGRQSDDRSSIAVPLGPIMLLAVLAWLLSDANQRHINN